MKKGMLIVIMMAMILAPLALPAEESVPADPLMGAVEFGTQEEPELVWKSGRIDSINDNGMVVDDAGYRFSTDIKYYSESGVRLTRLNFSPGTPVKFVLKKDLVTVVALVKI
ncbi:MAG: hypothetical protein AB1724_00850 [Thermodesulfobacteriota bacterium]